MSDSSRCQQQVGIASRTGCQPAAMTLRRGGHRHFEQDTSFRAALKVPGQAAGQMRATPRTRRVRAAGAGEIAAPASTSSGCGILSRLAGNCGWRLPRVVRGCRAARVDYSTIVSVLSQNLISGCPRTGRQASVLAVRRTWPTRPSGVAGSVAPPGAERADDVQPAAGLAKGTGRSRRRSRCARVGDHAQQAGSELQQAEPDRPPGPGIAAPRQGCADALVTS